MASTMECFQDVYRLSSPLGEQAPRALPILDPEQLMESLMAVGDDLQESLDLLRTTYLEDVPHLLDMLTQAAERSDFDKLRFAAHTLKSSSALMGATSLSEICRQLEEQARTQSDCDLALQVERTLDLYEQTVSALLAYSAAAS